MFDFIALADYAFYFYNFLLVFVIITFLDGNQYDIDDGANLRKKSVLGFVLIICSVIYMGQRPITYDYFGDMGMYNYYFKLYASGAHLIVKKDMAFELFLYGCSKIMSPHTFFTLCVFLYMFPMISLSKKFFDKYWYYGFLTLVCSYSFWGYGVNGIRNGLATSFFLYGLSADRKWVRYLFMGMAVLFHGSLIIPLAAYFLTKYYTNTKMLLYGWLLAIPLSAALGSFWESLFAQFSFGQEDRVAGYFTDLGEFDQFTKSGFRWDFILYSAAGTFAAWYFVIKKQYEDVVYKQIANIYIVVNAFWILVIRANYSNRFAYLSWFLISMVIFYPMLKVSFSDTHHKQVGRLIFVYFGFTYLMNAILNTV